MQELYKKIEEAMDASEQARYELSQLLFTKQKSNVYLAFDILMLYDNGLVGTFYDLLLDTLIGKRINLNDDAMVSKCIAQLVKQLLEQFFAANLGDKK